MNKELHQRIGDIEIFMLRSSTGQICGFEIGTEIFHSAKEARRYAWSLIEKMQ
jgi:hypothetical protein